MKNFAVLLIALAVCQTPTLSVGKSTFKAGVRSYTGTALQEIAFPIGGIGTGSISLGGRVAGGKEPIVTINGVPKAASVVQGEGTIQIVFKETVALKKGDVVRVS